jgi:hypothetical protein
MILLLGVILCWLAIGSLIGVSFLRDYLRAEARFPEEVDWSLIAAVAIVWPWPVWVPGKLVLVVIRVVRTRAPGIWQLRNEPGQERAGGLWIPQKEWFLGDLDRVWTDLPLFLRPAPLILRTGHRSSGFSVDRALRSYYRRMWQLCNAAGQNHCRQCSKIDGARPCLLATIRRRNKPMQFMCPTCGGPSIAVPASCAQEAEIACGSCGSVLGTWGSFKERARMLICAQVSDDEG